MKDEIRSLYEEMYAAMIAKDKDKLELLHDKNFLLVHITGMRQTKEEYIKAIISGVLNYYSVEHEEVLIDMKDDTAHLIGRSKVKAAVFGGGIHTWRLQLDMQLMRKNGSYIFTYARASTY